MRKSIFNTTNISFGLTFLLASCSSIEMIRPISKEKKVASKDLTDIKEKRSRISFDSEDISVRPEIIDSVELNLELDSFVEDYETQELSTLQSSISSSRDDESDEEFQKRISEQREKIDDNVIASDEREFEKIESQVIKAEEIQADSLHQVTTDLELKYPQNLYDFWNNYFTKRDKERFSRHLTNGEKYRSLIKQVFREYNLPEDLFYVGLIESGFNIHIASHAQAVGPWQFIEGTARRYGMRVESQIDERRNIVKATHGAAKYFRDLYNIFGSWELALSAYNAGEYRVINAIRRGNTRDFNELVERKLLPRETRYYVPKVAAARDISKNREKYGINVSPKNDKFYTNAVIVEAKRNFTLQEIAQVTSVDLKVLETLNPDFRWREMSATTNRPVQVVVPREIQSSVAQNFDRGTRTQYTAVAQSRPSSSYRVQRGDHLIGISRRFGVTVDDIKRANDLTNNRIYAGQSLRIPSTGQQGGATQYTVQRGDSLIGLARRFNVNVEDIRNANNLRGSRILIGQNLTIPGTESRVYVVRRGDNLTRIAQRFNTSISAIVRTNQLRSETIYPGQRLTVPN